MCWTPKYFIPLLVSGFPSYSYGSHPNDHAVNDHAHSNRSYCWPSEERWCWKWSISRQSCWPGSLGSAIGRGRRGGAWLELQTKKKNSKGVDWKILNSFEKPEFPHNMIARGNRASARRVMQPTIWSEREKTEMRFKRRKQYILQLILVLMRYLKISRVIKYTCIQKLFISNK